MNTPYNDSENSTDIFKRQLFKNVEKYNDHPLSANVFFFVAKKAEKIATALYMVTSFLEEGDALRGQVRNQSVLLVSDLYDCLETSMYIKATTLSQSIISVEHILSLLDMAHRIGSVSEMNLSILRRELLLLQSALHRELQTNTSFDAYREPHTELPHHHDLQKFFQEEMEVPVYKKDVKDIKDTQMSVTKNVAENNVSDKNVSLKKTGEISKRHVKVQRGEGEMRRDAIVAIIKDKKKVSMKDLATRITNCTEKTLQRDLAYLMKKGVVEKQGEKRWSVYVYSG